MKLPKPPPSAEDGPKFTSPTVLSSAKDCAPYVVVAVITGVVNVEPVPTAFEEVLVQTIVDVPEAPDAAKVTVEFPQDVPPVTVSTSVTGHEGGACWIVMLSIEMSPVNDVPRTPRKRIFTEAADGKLTTRSSHGDALVDCCCPISESMPTHAVPLNRSTMSLPVVAPNIW